MTNPDLVHDENQAMAFAMEHGFPIIMRGFIGAVGSSGLANNEAELRWMIRNRQGLINAGRMPRGIILEGIKSESELINEAA